MIGETLHVDFDPRYPAPNNYDIPSSIGDGEGGKTFGIRHRDQVTPETPLASYDFRSPKTSSHPFSYRAFPWKSKSK